MSVASNDDSSTEVAIPPQLAEDTTALNYKYRDFANVPVEIDNDSSSGRTPNRSLESSIRVQKFPVKLYAILGQKEFADIITWMPHGRSWKVLKPNLFESLIMPLFFEYSNYHSFNRLVNAWSFRRVSSGPDRGSYYHELFLRGKTHLQKYMRRLPKTHKKLPIKKTDEPDFYELAKTSPLPILQEQPPVTMRGIQQQQQRSAPPPSLQNLPLNPQTNQLTNSFPSFFNKPMMKDGLNAMNPMGTLGGPNGMGSLGNMGSVGNMGAGNIGQGNMSQGNMGQGNMGAGNMGQGNLMSAPPTKFPQQTNNIEAQNNPESGKLFQMQRMRHMQHIQMFQKQLNAMSNTLSSKMGNMPNMPLPGNNTGMNDGNMGMMNNGMNKTMGNMGMMNNGNMGMMNNGNMGMMNNGMNKASMINTGNGNNNGNMGNIGGLSNGAIIDGNTLMSGNSMPRQVMPNNS